MFRSRFVPFLFGALLLGALGCAAKDQARTGYQAQRAADLDRLDDQAGMPNTWPARPRPIVRVADTHAGPALPHPEDRPE